MTDFFPIIICRLRVLKLRSYSRFTGLFMFSTTFAAHCAGYSLGYFTSFPLKLRRLLLKNMPVFWEHKFVDQAIVN